MSEVWRDLPPEAAAERNPVRAQSESRGHRGLEGPAERSPLRAASESGSNPGRPDRPPDQVPGAGSLQERTPEAEERSRASPGENRPFGGGVGTAPGHPVQSRWTLSERRREQEGALLEPHPPTGSRRGREGRSEPLGVP